MVARDYANTRSSPLTQITKDNAAQLKVAWTFETGLGKGAEAAPLIIGDTLYLVTPFPNVLYALDLANSGAVKWKYEPKPDAAAQGVACCDVVNRGPAYADGVVFINTLDCHTCAVDAKTGKEKWKTKLGEINKGETITMAPLYVKGKVLVGNSGGEMGVRGWLTALDAKNGEIAWRAYSTGPDKDCLIGEGFHPYYELDNGKDLGVSSWPPEHWKLGGGTVWGFVSYDPALDYLYYGTANPGVWNPELRPGDNKWSCSIIARRPADGQASWAYQVSPHDLFDWDGVNENVLADLEIQGQTRKALMHVDRNGYVYVMDRERGQVLSATQLGRNTAVSSIDLKSGRPVHNPEKEPKTNRVVRDIQPFSAGVKDWQPCAYSAGTGLLYIPHQNMAMDYEGTEANYISGTPYLGVNAKFYAGPGGYRGVFTAWDPVQAKAVWETHEKFPVWSGAVVTDGGVVFHGTMDNWFKALDAKTGDELWKFKCGSGIIGQPVSFQGPDGKQYIAILSGVGGWAGAIVSGDLDARDPTAALGFVNGMKDLPQATTKGGTLYVFGLP
jgi:PQQ-dependent dehydrogenase (methanol/ethanol family)